jgi:hypothetical protein
MTIKRDNDDNLDAQLADDMLSMDVISATEVTGMVPTPPLTEAQAEGYRQLFPIPQPKAASARCADTPEEQEEQSSERRIE